MYLMLAMVVLESDTVTLADKPPENQSRITTVEKWNSNPLAEEAMVMPKLIRDNRSKREVEARYSIDKLTFASAGDDYLYSERPGKVNWPDG